MTAPKKLTIRRIATLLAAIGALVMSSGIALMVSASPASAANKVNICHATNSDSNPYVFISVDDDSVKLKGHLAHRQTPNKIWKTAGTFNGVAHVAGQAKPDLIGSFTDDQGVFHQYDGNITAASCVDNTIPPVADDATADVDFTDPSCANQNAVDWDGTGSAGVTFKVTSGEVKAGSDVEITATATNPTFPGGATTQVFTHHFGPLVDLNGPPCVIVNPPAADATANVTFTDPTCANSNLVDYSTTGDHVTFAVTSGSKAADSDIEITATADPQHTFADASLTKVFTHHFGALVDLNAEPCVDVVPPVVNPPVVNPPVVNPPVVNPPAITPTLVHAGIVPEDFRSTQGMALIAAGFALLIVAGGLTVAPAGRKRD